MTHVTRDEFDPSLWTAREVAEYHDVEMRTVYQWKTRGKLLPKQVFEGTVFYDPVEVKEVQRGRRNKEATTTS